MKNTLLPSFCCLLLSIALHYQRTLDWTLQSYLFSVNGWLVDENEPIAKLLFYDGPKYILVTFAIGLFAFALISLYRKRCEYIAAFYVLACLGLIPFLVGLSKKLTNEACPKDLAMFGGVFPLDRISGECFPGGHASGGFALFSLYWCLGQKKTALLPGLLTGAILGGYQMLKGAHFLSDTLCTAFFAWFLCEFIWKLKQNWSRSTHDLQNS